MAGDGPTLISAEEWLHEQRAAGGDRPARDRDSIPLIRVDENARSARAPLIVLVPGFMAETPSGEGPVVLDETGSAEAYGVADWVARGRELSVLSGCEVLVFAWPNGGTLVESFAALWRRLRNALPWAVFREPRGSVGIIEPLTSVLGVLALSAATVKWRRAIEAADRTPLLLHRFLTHDYTRGRDVLVVGHSLGGRIALKTAFLHHTSGGASHKDGTTVFVALAPAVGAGALSAEFKNRKSPIASVGYSRLDLVLRVLFRVGAPSEGVPLGVQPDTVLSHALEFVDCTDVRGSALNVIVAHLAYTNDLFGHLCAIPSAKRFLDAAKEAS